MKDLSRMSNQERIALLGVEEASKYHGPYSRREDNVDYLPAMTKEGGHFYLAQESAKANAEKNGEVYHKSPVPREYILPTVKVPSRKIQKIESSA